MTARRILRVPLIIFTLMLLVGCGRWAPRAVSQADEVAAAAARRLGGGALDPADARELQRLTRTRLGTTGRIQTVDDVLRAGDDVSFTMLQQTAPEAETLRATYRQRLREVAQLLKPADPEEAALDAVDFGRAIVEAHCKGLKHELASGEPATWEDYVFYLAIAEVLNQLPAPPAQARREVAGKLADIGAALRAATSDDEALYRSYVIQTCNVPGGAP